MKKLLHDSTFKALRVFTPLSKGLLLVLVTLVFSFTVFGHSVDSYTSTCNGASFNITPVVSSVNNTSNYNWQYMNSSGTWICLVNGSNTINGKTFTAAGVSASATVTPPVLSLTNLSASLDGIVFRLIIVDVNPPCNPGGATVYNGGTTSTNYTTSGSSCAVTNGLCSTCLTGYPNPPGAPVNLPYTGIVFSESDCLKALVPRSTNCGQQTDAIKVWYGDEHMLTMGIRQVIIIHPNNSRDTTNYPISAYPGSVPPNGVTNPQLGTTLLSGAKSGNDYAFLNPRIDSLIFKGRPTWPALYLTDITSNPNNRSGDWQYGGQPHQPTAVFGAWKYAVKTVDSTKNPVAVTIQPDADASSSNGWNLGSGDAPPAGTSGDSWGALIKWDIASLNLTPGHNYRMYVMVHDGDQNKTGGDVGDSCTNFTVPGYGSIGDWVWLDINKNGIQDNNEPGIAGDTVRLKNAAGVVIKTRITNSMGYYLFDSLAAGNYSVVFPTTLTSSGANNGATLTSQYAGLDSTIDSDPNPSTGITALISLASGQNRTDIDAGYIPACTVTPPKPSYYFPDNDVTFKNKHVSNSVATNDQMPPNTYYGSAPVLRKSPGSSHPTLLMSTSGVYDFVSDSVGRYEYDVPVCVPGAVPLCHNSILQIIVLDSSGTVANQRNPPVASIDFAVTQKNMAVTLNSLANDRPGNIGGSLDPTSVLVTVNPSHGMVTSVTPAGQIIYKPSTGYVGNDTLKYKVCQIGGGCDTTFQIIFIVDSILPNSTFAADDYNNTKQNTPVSGNAKLNDFDPEHDSTKVLAQTVTIPNTGTLVMSSNGNYTFTPLPGFAGDANIPYTICDSVVLPRVQACATATIHITVYPDAPKPDFTPIIQIDSLNFRPKDTTALLATPALISIEEVSDLFGIGNPSIGQVQFRITNLPSWIITFDSAATSISISGISQPVRNGDWTQTIDFLGNYVFTLKPGLVIPGNGRSRIGVKIQMKPNTGVNTFQNLTVEIFAGSGGDNQPFNNAATTTLTAIGLFTGCMLVNN